MRLANYLREKLSRTTGVERIEMADLAPITLTDHATGEEMLVHELSVITVKPSLLVSLAPLRMLRSSFSDDPYIPPPAPVTLKGKPALFFKVHSSRARPGHYEGVYLVSR